MKNLKVEADVNFWNVVLGFIENGVRHSDWQMFGSGESIIREIRQQIEPQLKEVEEDGESKSD